MHPTPFASSEVEMHLALCWRVSASLDTNGNLGSF